jgi:uncharacterized hydrophobic protein (TIGR00271 family)
MDSKEKANIDKLFKETKTKEEIINESKVFLFDYLNFRKKIDKEKTIEHVKNEISFKGHKSWILIFSIVVASIGLNIGSAAVVIGAMLIMPLMGPIVGIGLSVAINDIDTFKKSLINFVMIMAISILTAFLYFLISPLTKLTPELQANTYPTILNVLVAIFGGLALIISQTQKNKISSVIYGVAIATALMPPLCTAGYGLAVGNFEFFLGAFYLFIINSTFIALSAFVTTKILGFQLVRYANSKRRKRIAQIATTIAIVVMIPSALLFWKLLKQEIFSSNVEKFVIENVYYQDAFLYKYDHDFETKTIEIYMGGEIVPDPVINSWRTILVNDTRLKDVSLSVKQSKDENTEFTSTNFVTLSDMFSQNLLTLESREARIRQLEQQINSLTTGDIPFETLIEEVKINYGDLSSIAFSNTMVSNFEQIDTIPVFTVEWNRNVTRQARNNYNEKLKNWLSFKLGKENVEIREQN